MLLIDRSDPRGFGQDDIAAQRRQLALDELEQGRFAYAVAADQADFGADRNRHARRIEKAAAPRIENEILNPKHAGIPNAAEMVGGGCGRFLSCGALNGEGKPSSRRIADTGDFFAQDFKLQPLILRRRDLALQIAERRRRLFEANTVARIESRFFEP